MSPDVARRIALGAQGFATARPSSAIDVRHFRRVVRHVKVIQLDSVNVMSRAHYMPFYSRLGGYSREALDAWMNTSGEMFEYWAHVASSVPVAQYPLLHWRMANREPWGSVRELLEKHPEYLDAVLDEVDRFGPLTVGQLENAGDSAGPWWGWSNGKTILEFLFATGRISATRDRNFTRLYDLPERMLPPDTLTQRMPQEAEAKRELLMLAAEALGVATADDLADYYRINMPTARPLIASLVADGSLKEVEVRGWDKPAYIHPDARRPRTINGRALLSPFDSLIWHRDRTERLFDFHYRIEIYVPEAKRVFGYYVLPFLLDGELVARVDLKADRKQGVLLVRGSFGEPSADHHRTVRELAAELTELASWIGMRDVVIERKGDLAADLAAVI